MMDGRERRDLQPPSSPNRFRESDTRADPIQANHSLSHVKCMMLLVGPIIPQCLYYYYIRNDRKEKFIY